MFIFWCSISLNVFRKERNFLQSEKKKQHFLIQSIHVRCFCLFLQHKPNLYLLVFISIIDATGKKVSNQRVFFKQIIKSLILKIENRLLHDWKKWSHRRHCFTREKRIYSFVKWGTFTNSENQKCWHKRGRMLPQCNVKKRSQKIQIYTLSNLWYMPSLHSLTHSFSSWCNSDILREKLENFSCWVGLHQALIGNVCVYPEMFLPPSSSYI